MTPQTSQDMQQQSTTESSAALFAGYHPPTDTFDEAFRERGQARPEWQSLLDGLERMGDAELRRRWQQAQAQINRDGVTYNPHDDNDIVSRPWLLDAIPMILAEHEWDDLNRRLNQRARVLEALLNDLTGEQRVLKDRIVPPDLLYGHPAWYPSYQHLTPPTQRPLTYSVTDLARAPDGQWWATGDRTRSPFGLGYLLENRIVTSRMLSHLFRRMPVRRLAGFFATLKKQLRDLAPRFRENPRIVLWTRGPQSRGYFEDSYLARYLGYTLAEGDDLAVRGNRVQLLTLGGLLPVEVLLRRVDDDDTDSVELNPQSQIGISALLDVVRSGRVAVANSIGSRLVESPAFLPFLPAVCRHLLDEELQLPSVGTWWCGDAAARSHVLENLDRMLIRPAYRMADIRPTVGRTLDAAQRQELANRITAEPGSFVGQEIISRSTTPVLTENGVEPWYVGLRSFLVATSDGFEALPGGLARVSADSDSLNFTMTDGERSQDVWVVSESPVEQVSLLKGPTTQIEPRRSGAELPSRVADNFFWLGRYAERAAQSARLLRTLLTNLESEDTDGPGNAPLLRMLAGQGQIDPDHVVKELSRTMTDAVTTLPETVLDRSRPLSLQSTVDNVVRTAERVRDRISQDMWRAVDRLQAQFIQAASVRNPQSADLMVLLENSQESLSALVGLVAEGMTRTLGWRFFDLGIRLERTWQTMEILRSSFAEHRNDDADTLEALLTTADSLMTYRTRYLATLQVPVILDLLITDTSNPRSMTYQLSRINEHLNAMPGNAERALMTPEQKLAMSLANTVRLVDIYELSQFQNERGRVQLTQLLKRLEEQLPRLSDAISSRFLIHAGLPRHFGSSSRRPGLETNDN